MHKARVLVLYFGLVALVFSVTFMAKVLQPVEYRSRLIIEIGKIGDEPIVRPGVFVQQLRNQFQKISGNLRLTTRVVDDEDRLIEVIAIGPEPDSLKEIIEQTLRSAQSKHEVLLTDVRGQLEAFLKKNSKAIKGFNFDSQDFIDLGLHFSGASFNTKAAFVSGEPQKVGLDWFRFTLVGLAFSLLVSFILLLLLLPILVKRQGNA